MAKRRRRPVHHRSKKQTAVEIIHIAPHLYPPHWQPLDWLVPFDGEQLFIQHHHADPTDHSRCGPLLFCCLLAIEKYQRLPDHPLQQVEWQLQSATEMAARLPPGDPSLYFIFCDPIRPDGLVALGLNGDTRQAILFKQQPLTSLLDWPQITRLA